MYNDNDYWMKEKSIQRTLIWYLEIPFSQEQKQCSWEQKKVQYSGFGSGTGNNKRNQSRLAKRNEILQLNFTKNVVRILISVYHSRARTNLTLIGTHYPVY